MDWATVCWKVSAEVGSLLPVSPCPTVGRKPTSSVTNHLFPDLLPLIPQTRPGMCLAWAQPGCKSTQHLLQVWTSLLPTSLCGILLGTRSEMQPPGLRFEGAESSFAHWDDAPRHLALFLEMPFLRFGAQPHLSVKRCLGFPEGCVPWESHVFAQLLVWSGIGGNIP